MGQKSNVMCDYLEKPDKFADFINGSLYHGREVLRPERIRKMDEDTFDAVSVLINKPDFLKRKGSYREGDGINMCKAMEDWREDILKEGIEQGIEQGIRILILDYMEEGIAEKRIKEKLQKHFSLDGETAQGYLRKYAGGNA